MKQTKSLFLALLATASMCAPSSNAQVTAGVDFEIASSGVFYTEAGYLSVPVSASKNYNVTHNGITFDVVGTSTGGNQNRFRGLAANAGSDLTRDFIQWYSPGGVPEVAVTLSGLVPNSDYLVSFSHYNAGAGTTIHSHYEGTVATGTLLGEFSSGGNPANPATTWTPTVDYTLTSDGDGKILVTIIPTGAAVNERITLDGIGVTSLGPPPSLAPFNITEILLLDGDQVSLTWTSKPGTIYAVKATTDLTSWPAELDDSVEGEADSETTSRTYDIAGLVKNGKLYFRIEEG